MVVLNYAAIQLVQLTHVVKNHHLESNTLKRRCHLCGVLVLEEFRLQFVGKIVRCDGTVDNLFLYTFIAAALNSNQMLGKSEIIYDNNVQGRPHSMTPSAQLDCSTGYVTTGWAGIAIPIGAYDLVIA